MSRLSHVKCTDMMAEEPTVIQRQVLELQKVRKRISRLSKS